MNAGIVKTDRLEDDLGAELDVPGALAERRRNTAARVGHVIVEGVISTNGQVGVIECLVRRSVVGSVGHIVGVDPELARYALVNPDCLEDTHIEFIDGVTTESTAAYSGVGIAAGLGLVLVVD